MRDFGVDTPHVIRLHRRSGWEVVRGGKGCFRWCGACLGGNRRVNRSCACEAIKTHVIREGRVSRARCTCALQCNAETAPPVYEPVTALRSATARVAVLGAALLHAHLLKIIKIEYTMEKNYCNILAIIFSVFFIFTLEVRLYWSFIL